MFVLVIIDQLSKWFAGNHLPFHEAVNIMPFFSLYLTHNKGIAFSMLEWLGPGGLILLSAVIIVFMIYLWKQVPRHQQLSLLGFAFVIAGAIGNLIDRITQGHVIDFFLFHTQSWAFAVFNVADSFITIGAICIIIDELSALRRKPSNPE
jgi:signal peptidase II